MGTHNVGDMTCFFPYALYNMLVYIYMGVDFVEIRLMIEGSTEAGKLQAAP